MMSAFRISPVRGSEMCGPEAFSVVDGIHRITECRTSSGLKSGSSSCVGAIFAMIAFLNPAASNAGCQSSMPFFSHLSSVFGGRGATAVDRVCV